MRKFKEPSPPFDKKEIIEELEEISDFAISNAGCSCEDVLKDALREVYTDLENLIKKIK